jgi:hypothetical protein
VRDVGGLADPVQPAKGQGREAGARGGGGADSPDTTEGYVVVEEDEEDIVTSSLLDNECVGANCCSDGMIYDTVSRTCMPKEKKSQGKHMYLQYHDHESHSKHSDEGFTKGLPNNVMSPTSYNVKPYNS